MKKVLALSLIITFLVTMCDVPALSEPASENPCKIYEEYRDSLFSLQQDIAHVCMELHQGKNPQAVYEHILNVTEKTAVLIGKSENTSQNVHDILQIRLQDRMEMILILGLSERQKENLIELGYTEDDIAELLDWILLHNDHYFHTAAGFTPEEIEQFYSMGLTDEHIVELHTKIKDYYTQMYTIQQVVKKHQIELMHIQLLLSLAILQKLSDLDKGDKGKPELQGAEEKLLQAILNVSEDQSSIEQVKAFSKQVYKAAEKKVRTGKDQYLVDFFIGLQVHCGAITALNGDLQVGLAEIFLYKPALSECVASPERPLPHPFHIGGQPPSLEDVTPTSDFIGQIEESDEMNNVGSVLIFIKASDTTEWEAAKILFNFIFLIFGSTANVTFQGLVDFLGSCITESITITTLAIGSAGAILLLVLTAEPVGKEWPTSIKDPTGTFDEIIVDQATIAHIQDGAQREEKCERWSHHAILDDPWRIRFAKRACQPSFQKPYGPILLLRCRW